MIEVRQLYPRQWEPSDPLVAYNNADANVVAAEAMSRGNNSYYDRYGYQGSQDIVCADCKQDGRDVPLILVNAEKRRLHFRHQQGEAPDGLGRHGETAEHLRGKQLITNWAKDQHHVLPWSVEEEYWVTGVRLRSDVKATLAGGQQLAFEVQRKPMEWKDWDRRHGGYERGGIRDVWLWSPDVPDLVLDLPLTSVVLDMEEELIGILVANYSSGYRHPTAENDMRVPTHYAAAPIAEWTISAAGVLVPPPGLAEYIGDKPEFARLQQLRAYREGTTRPPEAPSRRPVKTVLQREAARSLAKMGYSDEESARINDVVARIFGRATNP
ncbi:competence protein CoiA family protein [Arthrobacter sp. FW306-06-A]|uniref:competence protein CoiA family protein n=1 Tax=Arthrobacter sp. FW306-06-A TaxID=2879621 RepID=UPI001F30203F|nr:competence protein CoiA family protein [Arthrobacter sp. FW306-06-A]UKA73422.1 hypothetical protein LFT49_21765 [Arthrobacter sp. FW306-06-A]